MRVVGLHVEVRRRIGGRIEVRDLRGEVSGLPGKRQVTGVRQLLGELEEHVLVLKKRNEMRKNAFMTRKKFHEHKNENDLTRKRDKNGH